MKYIIWFIYPKTKEMIYLANEADIIKIAYMKDPILPCTNIIEEAKIYDTLEAAKNDIYKLRYYHRKFLYVKTGIKKIINFEYIKKLNTTIDYPLIELIETNEN